MTEVREIVIELLGQLGSNREAQQYVQQFSRVEESRFAVVKVGGAVLRDQLQPLATALAFLHRLGLHPIILHGAGPQLDEALESAGIKNQKHDGLRVTTAEVMAVARPVIYRENLRLVEALEAHGVRARSLIHGVFRSRLADQDRLGLVGDVEEVELGSLKAAIRTGAMPVVACLGESSSGQMMNINADVAARELVWAIRPHKVIFLTSTGGLLDEEGRVISAITLREDYDRLLSQPWIHSGMRLKLEEIRYLFERLPPEASVSITSARNLTRELFTHTGAGTLIRHGERIAVEHTLDGDLEVRVRDVIEEAFGRRLRSDWPGAGATRSIFVAESGRAAAVIVHGIEDVAYLDKFAVTPEGRGEGLAGALWRSVVSSFPALYWRARVTNPVNGWYFQKADRTLKRDGWVAFTRGIADPSQAERVASDALARESGWVAEPEET